MTHPKHISELLPGVLSGIEARQGLAEIPHGANGETASPVCESDVRGEAGGQHAGGAGDPGIGATALAGVDPRAGERLVGEASA